MDRQKVDLMLRYLAGEANVEHRQQIIGWIELGQYIPEWEEALEIHAQRILKEGKYDSLSREIVEDLHANLTRKLFPQSLPSLQKSLPSRKLWSPAQWSIAAAIVAIVGFIGIWYVVKENKTKEEMLQVARLEQDVAPGRPRAFLKLADGRIQNLVDGTHGISVGQQLTYLDGEQVLTATDSEKSSATQTLITPRGGTYQIVLEDGTHVWMNAESSLTYPTKFDRDERRVMLIGEAYFDVAHDANRPFSVETNFQAVQVLGTTFNLTAYPNGDEITTLFSGSVKVINQKTENAYRLIPGQQAVVDTKAVRIASGSPDAVAWKDGRFLGNGMALIELLPSIERWYDVTFYWPENMVNVEKGYFSINRSESLSALLKALSRTYSVNFEIKGKEVHIAP